MHKETENIEVALLPAGRVLIKSYKGGHSCFLLPYSSPLYNYLIIHLMALIQPLLGKPEGRRPLGRPRRRWADNIRMDLQDVGCGYMDWIGLAQDRDRWQTLVSAVMNLRVP